MPRKRPARRSLPEYRRRGEVGLCAFVARPKKPEAVPLSLGVAGRPKGSPPSALARPHCRPCNRGAFYGWHTWRRRKRGSEAARQRSTGGDPVYPFFTASSTCILSSAKRISVFGSIARASASTEATFAKISAEPCVNTSLLILNFCKKLNRFAGGKCASSQINRSVPF